MWIMEHLIEKFGDSKHISVNTIKQGDFKEWGALLDMVYHKLATNCCSECHIFSVSASDPTVRIMNVDTLDTVEELEQDLSSASKARRRQSKDDDFVYDICKETQLLSKTILLQINPEYLPSEVLVAIPWPGISDIKQIELGKNWAALVPEKYRSDSMYQTPSDEVYARHKVEKEAKREVKRQAKKVKRQAKGTSDAVKKRSAIETAAIIAAVAPTTPEKIP